MEKAKKTRAQVAMEYVIIIGFVAAITLPMVIIFQTHSKETTSDLSFSQIYQIARRISDGAETVYYMGEPSKTTIKAYFPDGVDSVSVGDNEIVFTMLLGGKTNEIVVYTPVEVNGSVSSHIGIHYIEIESRGDYVWVSG